MCATNPHPPVFKPIEQECLKRLAAKFPGSPRVEVLTGIRTTFRSDFAQIDCLSGIEATETLNIVLKYYDDLLEADSANAVSDLLLPNPS